MGQDEKSLLRQSYHALKELARVAQKTVEEKTFVLKQQTVDLIAGEIAQVRKVLPDAILDFRPQDYFCCEQISGRKEYYAEEISAYLAVVVGKLTAIVEETDDGPVVQIRVFNFVRDSELRQVLERDYSEIQRAFISQCWKSVIILSGSAIEAILVDQMLANETNAKGASKAPKNKSDIRRWDLAELIEVAVELGIVDSSVDKLSHSVREYRNLVHPGNEIRNKLVFGAEEARIAIEVLHILHRSLS